MVNAAKFNEQISANLASLRQSNDQLVKVYLAANQSIPDTTDTMASWGLVDGTQIGTIWSIANPTRLVAPVAGKYEILVSLEWTKGNSTNSRNCSVIRNSPALQADLQSEGADGGRSNLNGKVELLMNAAAYVEIKVFQNSGGSEPLHGGTPDRSHACMRLIGT